MTLNPDCQTNRIFRLEGLDAAFVELLRREEEWPPSPPDMKALYTHFYNEIVKHARNSVCGSCGCIDHDPSHFDLFHVTEHSFRTLRVDPSLVPFNFSSGIAHIDDSRTFPTPGMPTSIVHVKFNLENVVRPLMRSFHFSQTCL